MASTEDRTNTLDSTYRDSRKSRGNDPINDDDQGRCSNDMTRPHHLIDPLSNMNKVEITRSNESRSANNENSPSEGSGYEDIEKVPSCGQHSSTDERRVMKNQVSVENQHDGLKRRRSTVSSIAVKARKSVPSFLKSKRGFLQRCNWIAAFCKEHLNFYRIHLLVFTFTPLIFAGIFYASNTTPIAFIDCLFVCVSAMTVTGLATINVSTSTAWQQAILFFLMAIGNITAVSVTMIWIRRHFFRVKFDSIIRRSAKARQRMNDVELAHQKQKRKELIRLQRLFGLRKRGKDSPNGEEVDLQRLPNQSNKPTPRSSASTDEIAEAELKAERANRKKERQRKKHQGPLRADMIRRMDQPAVLINPMGAISHKIGEPENGKDTVIDASSTGNNAGGGILNTNMNGEDNVRESEVGANVVPNIRIAEPTVTPSHLRRASVIDSPLQAQISPLTGRQTPEKMNEEEEKRMHADLFSVNAPPIESESGSARILTNTPSSADAIRSQMRTRFVENKNDLKADNIQRSRRESDPPLPSQYSHHRHGSEVHSTKPIHLRTDMFPRAQTIEFAEPPSQTHTHFSNNFAARSSSFANPLSSTNNSFGNDQTLRYRTPTIGNEFERTPTMMTQRSGTYGGGQRRIGGSNGIPITRTHTTSKERGFGGFPTPIELAGAAIKRALPQVQERFKRSTTVPRTSTFVSVQSMGENGWENGTTRSAPYLTFDATVSRNSRFHQLTEAQRDELGGVEYRAIDLLAKLLPIYWFGVNFFMIILVAPWLASNGAKKVHDVIASQGVNAPNTTWFWFFQVISAYSNTGLSLIDTSMIELNDQYLMLIPIAILILFGNTAFPIVLRFMIWILSLCVPKKSRTYETLRFLLDHPRRCFVYLFPSAQTWFLFAILLILNCFDWIMFQILDLGNATIEGWTIGVRIFDGLFQSIAVRAAGFQIVSLLQLAPAVQFLYIIMMYISAYPVAMSVRNTNVYEERSLGIFNESVPGDQDEPEMGGPRIWGTYLAAHARRQLAFDMWWLGFALWLVCIIERENIQDPTTDGWFTVFSCLFELTSAYGTVGLSTGTPIDDFSLSGRFHTLSKLVVIAVMLRGRHRGLPVAIDRAVLLPNELEIEDDAQERAYTIDEDGFIQTRSSYHLGNDENYRQINEDENNTDHHHHHHQKDLKDFNSTTSSTYVLPRTFTSSSQQNRSNMNNNQSTPKLTQTPTGSYRFHHEKSVPMMDLDEMRSNENNEHLSASSQAAQEGFIKGKGNDPFGLSSIRESANTPLPTPSENESDHLGNSNSNLNNLSKSKLSQTANYERTSKESNFDEKGKEKAKEEFEIDKQYEIQLAQQYGSVTEDEAIRFVQHT
ncbi:hypothetical protein L7F22_019011 [Adiantum nelumboides]|nr:hypothetical protein [Adiantum nelumboides]